MATQEDGWTVVAKPTTAKAATSSDDGWTVVAPAKTTAAPVEQEQTDSVWHNVKRTAAEAVIPTGSAFAGAAAGATIVAPYAASAAALSGPFAPVVGGAIELGGVLGGAFLASGAAKKVQDMLHQLVAPEDFKQRQIEKEQNPVSTFATELGTGLIGASPKTAVTATQGLSKLGRIAASPGGQRAVSGALQGGLEAGTELASEGEINPWKVIAATGAGVAMPGVNAAGRIPLAIGEKIGGKISSVLPGGVKPVTPDVTSNTDLPPKPTENSTPEERNAYIGSLKKRLAEKNAQVPVVEAAFRNKETGEVERVGKAHDEQQKIDLADTHEQGFVDERGNFLTRKEAWNRTKSAGQIPEGQTPVEPSTGLRSQDLRNAGDERFVVDSKEQSLNGEDYLKSIGVDRYNGVEDVTSTYNSEQKLDAAFKDKLITKQEYAKGLEVFGADPAKIKDLTQSLDRETYLLSKYAKQGLEKMSDAEVIEHFKLQDVTEESLVQQLAKLDKAASKREAEATEVEKQIKDSAYIGDGKISQQAIDQLLRLESRAKDARNLFDRLLSIQKSGGFKAATKPSDTLVTRDDYRTAISNKENKILTTELLAEEAAARGDKGAEDRHNQRAVELQRELDQLRTDMPAVKFADPSKPTWEELHDHLYGAKTVGEAFDRLSGLKELGKTKQLLLKALNQSEFIRSAKLDLSNDLLSYTDANGVEHHDAAGLYDHQDGEHKVTLGETGDVRVLLHEAMHAGTVRLLAEGNTRAAKELNRLYEEFTTTQKAKYQQALEAALKENGALTPAEYAALEKEHLDYGMTNVYEFVAEAFTSRKFQNMLKEITTGQRQKASNSMWGKFVEAVREGLNIPEGARTALDDVLEHGTSLVKKSKDFTSTEIGPTTLPSKSVKEMMREEEGKPDPRDMKDEDDFYKTAVDIYEKSGDKAAIEFYEGYKEYKKTWLEPVAETEKFVGTNLRNKLAGERVTSNNKAEILDIAAKDGVNLEQLTYKIDRGDKLDGAEKTIAEKFRKFMDDLGKRALDAGVINGWHEDYVARNVVSEGDAPKGALEEFMRDIFGKGEGGSGGTKTTTKYGEQRRLKTRDDLLKHLDGINGWLAENGKDYRFKLKSDNLADIYADYAHSVEKAIENKNLITNLKQVRNAAGESLIRPITKDDPLPHGWEVMDNSELAGYAVHPDLLPALKFVFDAGPGQLMQAMGTISQVTKRINVVGSFFHAKSLMEVMSSAQIPIWTPIKEAMVLPLVEKGVKKLTGKDLQLSAISKAVEQYKKGGVGDNVDRWIKEGGLQLDAPEDVSRGMLSSIGKFADSMIGKYGPKTRVLESSLSTVEKYTLGLFDKYTWDYLHTGGKLMVADAYLDKARRQAAEQGKFFDEDAARTEIARFVNDSFGGLNWFDAARSAETELGKRMAMAAYSPAGRRSLQLVLFAPDWTISTLRAFSSALPKGLNPTKWSPVEGAKGLMTPTTKADYARLYQFKTAVTYLTLINVINMMISNRPVWENKDPTRIEWPDGTSMQAMKHAMEPVHWIMDPDKTLSNKLGFIPKALIVGIAGTEYASPNAPKLVDRSATNRLKTAAQGALPFQVSAAKDAPKGEGAKRALLGTMGFPVYGSTPEQRKLKNAERELQTKELAWEYRDKEIKAGRERMTTEHINQGRTLAKRRADLNRKLEK